MTTSFPTALDALTNPTGTDPMDSATVPHAEQHANANDAIEALQTKVGVNGSAVAGSLDYRVAAVETGKAATSHNHDAAYVNVGGDSMTGPLNITASTTPQVLTSTQDYKDATQVIPNSEFADASSWTLSGGWVIDSGALKNPTAVAGNISVPLTGLTAGASYVIEVGMTTPGCYFFPSSDGGTTQKSYWRYWESNHFGFVAPSANFTLTLSQNFVTAAVVIDYIRMYKVISNADRVMQGVSATSTTFDLTTSNTSFGLGQNALKNAGNALRSIAIGNDAMAVAVRPYNSIAIGGEAMKNAQGPSDNIAIGYQAMRDVAVGSDNICIGNTTNVLNKSGNANNIIGSMALASATNASNNSGVGISVLSQITDGWGNVAIGLAAGSILTGGANRNTIVGVLAASSGTTGAYTSMVLLGYNAGGTTLYSSSICLGIDSAVTGNNQVQLGPSGYTTYAYGAVQDRSDRRDKRAIRPTVLGLDFIKRLNPVDYKWDLRDDYRAEIPEEITDRLLFLQRDIDRIKNDDSVDQSGLPAMRAERDALQAQVAVIAEANLLDNITTDGRKQRSRFHHGFIAQDIRDIIQETGVDFGGYQNHKQNGGQDVLSLGYAELIAPLVKAVQEQQVLIEALQAQVAALAP